MKTISKEHNTQISDHDVISHLIEPQFLLIAQMLIDEKNYALAPANMVVYQIIECLKKLNLPIPIVYDDQPKAFNTTIVDIEGLPTVDKIFVIAYSQKEKICQKLFSIYGRTISIIPVDPPEEYIQNNQWHQQDLKKLSTCKESFEDVEENHLLFVFGTHFSDVPHKIETLAGILNAKVFWVGGDSYHFNDKMSVIDNVDFFRMVNCYQGKKKITIFSTAVLLGYVFVSFIKQLFNDYVKVILYVYDYLPFISEKYSLSEIAQVHNIDLRLLNKEYEAALHVSKVLDIIIYKDKGLDYLDWGCNSFKKVFWPIFFKNNQTNKQKFFMEKNKFKTIYIGNLIFHEDDKNSYTKQFDLISVFNKILDSGMSIDIYYNWDMTSLYQYKNKINNARFLIKNGLPMQEFITSSNECYGWGLCLASEEVERDVDNLFLSYAFPSKISAYIALGIPIIVSEQFIYCAQIVQENNIGIIIKKSDTILEIKQKIEMVDLRKLYANMKQFQVLFEKENMAKQF